MARKPPSLLNNPFRDAYSLNLAQNQTVVKWVIVAVALAISAGSIYYTNTLVERLKERERGIVTLFAQTLNYLIQENQDSDVTFAQQILQSNETVPMIWTDSYDNPQDTRNLHLPDNLTKEERLRRLKKEIEEMRTEHAPIEIALQDADGERIIVGYVYYKNSYTLTQLRYYPYIQLAVIAIFGLLAYSMFSYSRTAQQNKVWIGLAKETAHQLGTPLSSLMAWIEYFRSDPTFNSQGEIIDELDKDVKKLEMITARFSSIGSEPVLQPENLLEITQGIVTYLQKRLSSKVKISVSASHPELAAKVNRPLFEWVIENLCKNAVDAMHGVGRINVDLSEGLEGKIFIDVADNGKGIPKANLKRVFQPGYTTKKRGWGLGLALVKRIVENYHKGRIFVKQSEVDKGTTFRIILDASLVNA